MNIIEICDFKVMVDYGHNAAAVKALSEVYPHISSGKVIGMHSGTGNRRDEDIVDFGRTLGDIYDRIVLTDSDPRRRKKGETAELVRQGILDAGFPEEHLEVVLDAREATKKALEMAGTGDLVVLQADNVEQVIADVFEYKDHCTGQG
jgi:cyanophycin synthetase